MLLNVKSDIPDHDISYNLLIWGSICRANANADNVHRLTFLLGSFFCDVAILVLGLIAMGVVGKLP